MLSVQFAAAIFNAQIGGTSAKAATRRHPAGHRADGASILVNAANLLNAGGADRAEFTTYIGYLNQLNNKAGLIPASGCSLTAR
jgi:hypothetical protein